MQGQKVQSQKNRAGFQVSGGNKRKTNFERKGGPGWLLQLWWHRQGGDVREEVNVPSSLLD